MSLEAPAPIAARAAAVKQALSDKGLLAAEPAPNWAMQARKANTSSLWKIRPTATT